MPHDPHSGLVSLARDKGGHDLTNRHVPSGRLINATPTSLGLVHPCSVELSVRHCLGNGEVEPSRKVPVVNPECYPLPSAGKFFGTILAKRGYVTVSTTVSQHEVYEEGRLLMGERLWDLIRCVDYLESMPEVDRSRIGCAGLSLGGEMAMWLGARPTEEKMWISRTRS